MFLVTTGEEFRVWVAEKIEHDFDGVQSGFARKVGATPSTVQGWLKGNRPSPEWCQRIATAYGLRAATIRRMAGYPADESEGITISSTAPLAADEERLLEDYRSAGRVERQALREIARLARGTGTRSEAAAPPAIRPPRRQEDRGKR